MANPQTTPEAVQYAAQGTRETLAWYVRFLLQAVNQAQQAFQGVEAKVIASGRSECTQPNSRR